MKITSAKALMAWCDQAPKICERIDWDEMPDDQKDRAVVGYLIDIGTPAALTTAHRLNLGDCPDQMKEGALRATEYEIQYMVRQYNDLLDLRDAEKSTPRYFDWGKFLKRFDPLSKMRDAGHKPEDFC